MGDQPGAGKSNSYKIKGHSRQRRSVKPYSRPSDHKKGILESVKDFFSPSWLVDFWKGKKLVNDGDADDSENDEEGQESRQTGGEYSGVSGRLVHEGIAGTSNEVLDNGGVRMMASVKRHNETTQKSGLSSLLSIRSRTGIKRESFETRTTGFPSNVSESIKSCYDYSQTPPTDDGITIQTCKKIETAPVSRGPSSSTSAPRPDPSTSLLGLLPTSSSTPEPTSSLFGPGPSSTGSQDRATPGPSLLSGRPHPKSVFRGRPEFSVSAFGSPLPPRPSSQTRRYSSPYYSGKTVFGGAASSHSSKRARVSSPGSQEHAKPVKRQIRPTPVSGPNGGGVASQTAKRILETLEKMSSPLVDAKKIPPSPPFSTSSSPLSFTQSTRRRQPQQNQSRPVGSPRKLEAQFNAPPVQALSILQRASISRIKPTTISATTTTQITSTPLVTSSNSRPSSQNTVKPSFVPTPLPMSLSPMEKGKGGGGKIRATKTSSTHYKVAAEDEEEAVNPLPVITSAVPLKLPSNTSLASFTFTKPTAHTTSNTQSSPAISTLKSKPADVSSNNFKFSVPEPKISTSSVSLPSKSSPQKTAEFAFSSPAPVNTSEKGSTEGAKDNSLLNKFKPAEGSWECSTCLVNNKQDATSCIACDTPKPLSKPPSQPSNDLLKKFQPPIGSWTCDTCMLTNKPADEKCIACEAPKPSQKEKETVAKPENLLKTFAPPSNSWECPTCMINNKEHDLRCVACEEPKPGSKPKSDSLLLKQFAPAPGSWTCDTCMIVNKGDVANCLACETPKPGGSTSGGNSTNSINSPFRFGSGESNAGNGETTAFKLPNSNAFKVGQTACVSFGFGGTPATTSSKSVTFGSSDAPSSSKTFQFGSSETASNKPIQFGSNDTTSSTKGFQFGVSETASSTKPIQFGSASTSDSNSKPFIFGASQDISKDQPFQFGKPADSKSSESATIEPPPTFKFGSSKESTEKQSTVQFGSTLSTDSSKPVPFAFAASKSPLTNSVNSQIEKESPKVTTPSQQGGPASIAQAAAAGLLKIPSAVDVVDLTDEPKKDVAPPNVNLFTGQTLPSTSQTSTTSSAPTKPEASPFTFGAASAPTTKPAEDPPKAKPFSLTPAVTSSTALTTFAQPPAAATTAATGFVFGSAVASTDKPASNLPSFPGIPPQATTAPPFPGGMTSASPFNFKGTTDPVQKFGSTSSTNSSSGFAFDSAASSRSSGFAFGAVASQPGASTVGSTAAPFVFGANTGETPKSGFNFGSSTQSFSFGGSAAATVPTPQGGVAVSEESMDADGNNNSPQTVPSFGSTATAPSAFGFPATPSNTGFNFSGAQQPTTFKFGGADATPPVFGASGGMGSGTAPTFGATTSGNAPQQQGASGAFNFVSPAANSNSSQPAGGFTVGTSTFTAGTANTGSRKIKRGIRRSNKR